MAWQGDCPQCGEQFCTTEIRDSQPRHEKTFYLELKAQAKCPKCGEPLKVYMNYSKC